MYYDKTTARKRSTFELLNLLYATKSIEAYERLQIYRELCNRIVTNDSLICSNREERKGDTIKPLREYTIGELVAECKKHEYCMGCKFRIPFCDHAYVYRSGYATADGGKLI